MLAYVLDWGVDRNVFANEDVVLKVVEGRLEVNEQGFIDNIVGAKEEGLM